MSDQLEIIVKSVMNDKDVKNLVEGQIKNNMKAFLDEYKFKEVCAKIFVESLMKEQIEKHKDDISKAIRAAVENETMSTKIKMEVERHISSYGETMKVAMKEMQPYINGRVAEAVKSADMKDVIHRVSDKLAASIFAAIEYRHNEVEG